ncbi:unnamed protein product [Sympodiomycopsis kandeliae]
MTKKWLSSWWNLYGLRNFIIGPTTEEIIWRSSILSVHHFAGYHRSWLIFGTPLYFGIAHLHHAWETYNTKKVEAGNTKSTAIKIAILQSGFQFTYTTLFGWYANFLFLRTGSIVPPLLSHVFCNIMGFPNPGHAIQYFPDKRWHIYGTYLLGIVGFCCGINYLTRPELFGGSVFWP